MSQKLYFIVGPTAIGKSSLAIQLACRIKGTIINADSMQVYKNLKILTARPSLQDLKKAKHELYGHVEGSERYNVSKWCKDIIKIINYNEKKNEPSIIVGGTGLYINTLLEGLIDVPTVPEIYKSRSGDLFKNIGFDNFKKIVEEFDPESLTEVSDNDQSRIRRIWEVYKFTGVTFSNWKKKQNEKFLLNLNYNIYLFTPPRDKIYKKVNSRFLEMIKNGAIEEVRNLNNLNLNQSLPIMKAHGVPEITNFLKNKTSLDECIAKGQQVTRNYVKRQLTWWRYSKLPIYQIFKEFPNEIDENMVKI